MFYLIIDLMSLSINVYVKNGYTESVIRDVRAKKKILIKVEIQCTGVKVFVATPTVEGFDFVKQCWR